MRTQMTKIFALSILGAALASSQTTTTSTTLSAAVTSTSANLVVLASGTNVAQNGNLFIDGEMLSILPPTTAGGTRVSVRRGANGTPAQTHASGSTVWVAAPGQASASAFRTYSPGGSCTATNEPYLPVINTAQGTIFNCIASKWVRIGGPQTAIFCGATSGSTTCANVSSSQVRIIGGVATLASNTATISGISPPFTGATTFSCVGNDITTRANPVQVVPTSASSIVITNTTGASDVVDWICVGL